MKFVAIKQPEMAFAERSRWVSQGNDHCTFSLSPSPSSANCSSCGSAVSPLCDRVRCVRELRAPASTSRRFSISPAGGTDVAAAAVVPIANEEVIPSASSASSIPCG